MKTDYIECALWASCDENGEPLDNYGVSDIHPDTLAQMEADCDAFLALIDELEINHDDWSDEQMGHDFWLSRNGHGAGFWDRGFESGGALHKAAKSFGSFDLYVGDDGMIYGN